MDEFAELAKGNHWRLWEEEGNSFYHFGIQNALGRGKDAYVKGVTLADVLAKMGKELSQ